MVRTISLVTKIFALSTLAITFLLLPAPLKAQFAYVANEFDGNVSGYTINSSTGALTAISGSPFPTGYFPRSIAVTGCTTPPSITGVSTNPAVLWPPDHEMVDVAINYTVTAPCGEPPVCVLTVASNRTGHGTGRQYLSGLDR
jgi:hypothetical protein